MGGRIGPIERAGEFREGQALQVGPGRRGWAQNNHFKTRRWIDGRDPHSVTDLVKLNQGGGLARAHAARFKSNRVHTSSSAEIRCSIRASSWKGDGVKRRRSAPRGTVGKLIG